MATTQIVKWGNSLAVRIPKTVAQEAGVGEGDPIVIEAGPGQIQLRRSQPRVPSLRKLVAQITPENRYDEMETGSAQGKENLDW
ncbi:MAG: AbrB/MazE/SpoVT family DNA-binding domain-containing protein [Candidatus Sulfotelmatobacter sp.]